MSRRIALLRAVNVSGSGKIVMADLKAMVEGLGFREVATLLQSGNVVFEAGDTENNELEQVLEAGLKERLGVATDVLVRDVPAWAALIAANPMPEEAERAPGGFLALVLGAALDPRLVAKFEATAVGGERVHATEAAIYACFPNGMGRSKLGTLMSKPSSMRATGRNWNTVLKLKAMVET